MKKMLNNLYKIINLFFIFILSFIPVFCIETNPNVRPTNPLDILALREGVHFNDYSPEQGQISWLEPLTENAFTIIKLYDYIWGFLIFVLIFVGYFLWSIYYEFNPRIKMWEGRQRVLSDSGKVEFDFYAVINMKHVEELFPDWQWRTACTYVLHDTTIELIWTIIPIIILIAIILPSLSVLYFHDNTPVHGVELGITGHQWYWTIDSRDLFRQYQFMKVIDLEDQPDHFDYDIYMTNEDELPVGALRLLETDEVLFLPTGINLKWCVTSDDVIHAVGAPSFGVKIDAVPGRVNTVAVKPIKSGITYIQCVELCGVNHGYMPIKVCIASIKDAGWGLKTTLMGISKDPELDRIENRHSGLWSRFKSLFRIFPLA